jgi:uncharacterized protein YggE
MKAKIVILVLIAWPGLIVAQEAVAASPFVRASGEATITAKPDRAQISIGVSNEAPTAQAAAAQNAQQTTTVLNAVKQALGSGGKISTSGYAISPKYQYANGQAPKLTGYQASNTVVVVVDELARLASVIDHATAFGANNINGISFGLHDDSTLRNQALAQATTKAQASAEAMANALHLHVLSVLRAESVDAPQFRPMTKNFVALEASAPRAATPIEEGELEVHASVVVTLRVGQ